MANTFTARPDSDTLDTFAAELNDVRENAMKQVGEADAHYIRKIIRIQRLCEISGLISIPLGFFNPLIWVIGVLF